MRVRCGDGRHESPGDFDADCEIRSRYLQLNLKASPDSWIKKARVISNANRDTKLVAQIEVLQECIHNSFYLANFVGVIAKLGDGVELVKEQKAAISVGKREQATNVACGCSKK